MCEYVNIAKQSHLTDENENHFYGLLCIKLGQLIKLECSTDDVSSLGPDRHTLAAIKRPTWPNPVMQHDVQTGTLYENG